MSVRNAAEAACMKRVAHASGVRVSRYDMCECSVSIKPVFHSFISLPPAKNYDSKIIFLCPFAAKEISSGPPIVENVLLLLHLLFMELQNN